MGLRRAVIVATLSAGAFQAGGTAPADAFDFFGLWTWGDTPPPVAKDAIAYSVTVDIAGGDGSPINAVKDASSLYSLRQEPAPDGDSLARRALRDFAPMVDALWGAGYYNASVSIAVDGAALTIGAVNTATFSRVLESYRGRAVAPLTIKVDLGPQFRLRTLRIVDSSGQTPEGELPQKVVGLKPGDAAAAADLRAAQARIVEHFRALGHPFAKIESIAPVVDHAADVMDVTLVYAPGPFVPFGEATLVGPKSFDPAIARSYLYIEPGDPYSPKALDDARKSIRKIPAAGDVRITETSKLDAYGRLPLQIGVGDRLPYAAGFSAKYSTTEGPAVQAYWEDRNLFGGAERLRLQADLTYAAQAGGSWAAYRRLTPNDIGGRITASFLKPALAGSRNDLLIDAYAERVSTNTPNFIGYTASDADLTVALRHRFNDTFSVQAGLEAQQGFSQDALGTIRYRLVGVPVLANYDTTDSALDPTHGVRLGLTASAFPMALGSSLNMGQAKVRASAYYSLDADSRFVLAGRVAGGGMAGPALGEIPANWRFYAGGGGSVRGYGYNTLGPTGPGGAVIGGKSVFEASAELRIRVTDTIGIVPFFDAGNAFASSLPNFSLPLQMSAGLGLRYYTAIGPIRLDLAAPINPRPGDNRFALYVSVGQAF